MGRQRSRLIRDRRGTDRRGNGAWERVHEGLGGVEELQEAGDSEASGKEMGSGGRAKEVAAGLPEVIAVHEDVLEGVMATAVWAGGVVASSGTKAVRIIRVKGVSRNELEARGLKGLGASEEDALGKGG